MFFLFFVGFLLLTPTKYVFFYQK